MTDFRFTCLGTGCPVATMSRLGPAHLVQVAGRTILIDCGSGVSQQLVAAGTRGADVDLLIVTHYHSDHLIDFWQLVVSSWHQGRQRPWRVMAPRPAINHMQKQIEAFADEVHLRILHEQRPSADGLKVHFAELVEGPVIFPSDQEDAHLSVQAFEVDHRPVVPAFGLRFHAYDRVLVFSGDTAPCPALSKAAVGADLLVQEVFVSRDMPVTAGVRSAATVGAVQSYHCTPDQVARIANEGMAGALLLTHIVPPATDQSALIREIRQIYDGPVMVGEDLMQIDLIHKIMRCGRAKIGF